MSAGRVPGNNLLQAVPSAGPDPARSAAWRSRRMDIRSRCGSARRGPFAAGRLRPGDRADDADRARRGGAASVAGPAGPDVAVAAGRRAAAGHRRRQARRPAHVVAPARRGPARPPPARPARQAGPATARRSRGDPPPARASPETGAGGPRPMTDPEVALFDYLRGDFAAAAADLEALEPRITPRQRRLARLTPGPDPLGPGRDRASPRRRRLPASRPSAGPVHRVEETPIGRSLIPTPDRVGPGPATS